MFSCLIIELVFPKICNLLRLCYTRCSTRQYNFCVYVRIILLGITLGLEKIGSVRNTIN